MISGKVKGVAIKCRKGRGCHKMWKGKRGKIFFKRKMMGSIKYATKYGKGKRKET